MQNLADSSAESRIPLPPAGDPKLIEYLREDVSVLPPSNAEFAESLLRQHDAGKPLSDNQLFWVERLVRTGTGRRHADARKDLKAVFLYMAQDSGGRVKIGISKAPRRRVKAIQTGTPFPVILVHQIEFPSREVARREEMRAHEACAKWRTLSHREWFGRKAAEWFRNEYVEKG